MRTKDTRRGALLLASLISGCSTAQFTGANSSKASVPATPVTCTASPSTVTVGQSVTITVTGDGSARDLYQSWDAGAATPAAAVLVESGSGYTVQGGGPDVLTPTVPGTNTVELRFDTTAAAADAACSFTVVAPPAPAPAPAPVSLAPPPPVVRPLPAPAPLPAPVPTPPPVIRRRC